MPMTTEQAGAKLGGVINYAIRLTLTLNRPLTCQFSFQVSELSSSLNKMDTIKFSQTRPAGWECCINNTVLRYSLTRIHSTISIRTFPSRNGEPLLSGKETSLDSTLPQSTRSEVLDTIWKSKSRCLRLSTLEVWSPLPRRSYSQLQALQLYSAPRTVFKQLIRFSTNFSLTIQITLMLTKSILATPSCSSTRITVSLTRDQVPCHLVPQTGLEMYA